MQAFLDIIKSRTVISGFIAALCGVLAALFKWSPDTVAAINTNAVEAIVSIGVIIGAIGTIIFRVKAKDNIDPSNPESELKKPE